jgi:hypothetical protein
MKKDEFQEMCKLSEQAYGHKYYWKKLVYSGRIMPEAQNRKVRFSAKSVKAIMEQVVSMKTKEQNDETRVESLDSSTEG